MPDWRYPDEPSAWPQRWRRDNSRAPDPMSGIPGRGTRVQVFDGRDRHGGQIGIVQRVTFDAGELVLTVTFADGTADVYFADQVLMRR
ncbi:hypothetical protein [Mycobacterium neumannii]|uniref:hypothetical protein n=1 Tax=Mycobacterium neumannii TaxID=2048551 RepID=UPI003AB1747E